MFLTLGVCLEVITLQNVPPAHTFHPYAVLCRKIIFLYVIQSEKSLRYNGFAQSDDSFVTDIG